MEEEEAQVAVMVEETYERLDKVERYFCCICNRICRHETYECLNEVDRYLFPLFSFVFEHECSIIELVNYFLKCFLQGKGAC